MRSAPARRAAVVALASASSAVVCATALAKAGAASIVLFITFPPLSRPGKPPETTKDPALLYRLPRPNARAERRCTRRRPGDGAAERDGPPAPDEPGADGLSMDGVAL